VGAERVLIDTSVWIAYFRGTSPEVSERVDQLMSGGQVCVPRVVIAELIQASKSEREISTIEGFLDAFTIVDQTGDTWPQAGKLAYHLKRKGKTVHLTDCYIAVIAQEEGCLIYTLDEHFKDIEKVHRR
jgi:predicted nucleic acid-binding protein